MTSVVRSDGRSAKNARNRLRFIMGRDDDGHSHVDLAQSPPGRRWPPLRQPRVNAPSPAGASDREPQRCEHRNQQFPDPGGAPLRNPKAAEKQKSHKCGGPGQQTDDKQDTERDLGQALLADRSAAARARHQLWLLFIRLGFRESGVAGSGNCWSAMLASLGLAVRTRGHGALTPGCRNSGHPGSSCWVVIGGVLVSLNNAH